MVKTVEEPLTVRSALPEIVMTLPSVAPVYVLGLVSVPMVTPVALTTTSSSWRGKRVSDQLLGSLYQAVLAELIVLVAAMAAPATARQRTARMVGVSLLLDERNKVSLSL